MASHIVGSLATPLIQKEISDSATAISESTSGAEDTDDEIGLTRRGLVMVSAISLLVFGGVAASIVAMGEVHAVASYVMGIFFIFTAPAAPYKQLRIAKSGGIRKAINRLREQANILKVEMDILEETVADLKEEASCLADIEAELDAVVREQGYNADEVVRLKNENEEILQQNKMALRQIAITDLTRIVISVDRDGDMKINRKELHILTVRLQIRLEAQGIILDTRKFEALIKQDNDISHVLAICGELLTKQDEEVSEDDEIDEDDVHDRRAMFTVAERYTKGSVDVARGSRMTLMAGRRSTVATLNRAHRKMERMSNFRLGMMHR